MLVYLLQGAALALPATLQPGPLQAFLASQALTYGGRRTLPAAAAPLATDGPIITVVLLALMRMPPALLLGLRVLGGAFLIYLAIGVLRRLHQPPPTEQVAQSAGRQSFWKAVTLNILNPNAYLFWGIVAGPILLDAWREWPPHGIAFVAGFYLTFIASLGAFILAVGSARSVPRRLHQALVGVTAVALAGFGFWQIAGGVTSILS
jgi:threonine/homoserine/homoserine lactone efflux protein